MSNIYIQLAHQGQNNWWRYIIGTVFSLFLFLFVGSTATLGLLYFYATADNNPATQFASIEAIEAGKEIVVGGSPLVIYAAYNAAFLFFLLGVWLSVRLFHHRGLMSLVTPYRRISWKRIAQGFCVFFLIKTIEIMVSYALAPQEFTFNFQLVPFLLFLPLVALITPIQTTAEELFFRGYLLQGVGAHLGKWMAMLLPSLLFCLLHLSNPEVTSQSSWEGKASLAIYFFMIAVFLAWLTIKDNSLELAAGVHAANNMATFLLVTSDNSVLPSPAIFSIAKIEANFASVFFTALTLWIFSFVIFRLMKRPVLPIN
ncbi:MAG: CPBP family intramembrane glutamic endopeptidase [Cyanobacteria bacterium J06634_6]